LAAFRLAVDRVLPLEQAWTLVSQRPAAAVGLADRGIIAPGQRADLIMVDADDMRRPPDRRDGERPARLSQRRWPYRLSEDVRYAIYFVPQAGTEFYRFGAAALGYDCHTGDGVPFLKTEVAAGTWARLTEAPRTYGFHATMKAPFRLHPEFHEND